MEHHDATGVSPETNGVKASPHRLKWMLTRGALATAALVVTIAANANLKYALECGAAKSTPPDNDSDPIYKTKIAVTDEVIYVMHYAASGQTYIRNEQYRDQRFWAQEKNDNWSGVSIKRPDWTMVGTIRMDKGASG
jgi:hypothetical protein